MGKKRSKGMPAHAAFCFQSASTPSREDSKLTGTSVADRQPKDKTSRDHGIPPSAERSGRSSLVLVPRIRAASIEEHRALTREALLDAARVIIEAEGSSDIPLADVALEAGVGRTTFYEYFADRDDLIASLVEAELPNVIEDLIDSVPRDLPPVERLAVLAVKTVEFVADDRVFGSILHRDVGRMGPDAQKRIREAHSGLATELTDLYMRGVGAGLLRAMPAHIAGRLIGDTLMAGARLLIDGVATREEVAHHIRNFLLSGLGLH